AGGGGGAGVPNGRGGRYWLAGGALSGGACGEKPLAWPFCFVVRDTATSLCSRLSHFPPAAGSTLDRWLRPRGQVMAGWPLLRRTTERGPPPATTRPCKDASHDHNSNCHTAHHPGHDRDPPSSRPRSQE